MRAIKLLLLFLTISMSANAQDASSNRYEQLYANFEMNFVFRYGVVDPNVSWGFRQKRSKVRIMAEDLGSDDFDYNDVVFDVEFLSDSEALITLLAVGSTSSICIGDEDHIVHKLLGLSDPVSAFGMTFDPVSFTLKGDFKGMAINIPIKVKGSNDTEWFELTAVTGRPPLKIAVPTNMKWNPERMAMDFHRFEDSFFYGESSGESTNKCSTPTISYSNGKIVVSCDTDGATCNTTITNSDIKSYTIKEIKLDATYIIRSYASKQGYNDSETATATLCWIDVEPKAEGIVNGVASVRSYGVMIQASEGFFNISGLEVGTPISVYNTAGQMVGSANASANTTTVNTTLRNGEIGIVKIGDKSVKVLMK